MLRIVVCLAILIANPLLAGDASAQEDAPSGATQTIETTAPDAAPVEATPSEAPAEDADVADENAELRARLEALEAQVAALSKPADEPAAARTLRERVLQAPEHGWWDKLDLKVSGYIQAQYESSQLSEDEVTPDGGALNQDRFLIRRGRLRVDRYFKYAHVGLEIDANTVRGPFLSLRRAEASFFLPNRDADLPPYVMITGGLSEIPFGHELVLGNKQRVFMERTTGSLAFFRGEPDVGVRISGAASAFRYAIAVQNGVPLDDRPNAVTTDFNKQKTVVGRLGFDAGRADVFQVSGGVSFLAGTGFHTGSPATKSSLLWRDLNEDGNVSLNELVAAPGQAASPSSTFGRWGANLDLELGVHSLIGWTRLSGEFTLASNLDRSYYVADPVVSGYDVRETSWYAAIVQEVTPYGLLAFRADGYNPNSDLFEARRGLFVPADASVLTLSPVFGLQLPRRGKLLFQYDHVQDQLGRDDRGVPTDLKNDHWTLRLQVEL